MMVPSTGALFVAALAVCHAFAANPEITPAPTPTQALDPRAAGASGTPILSTLAYPYTALPSQVYPFAVLRGPQFGYNQCGAANATDSANCQTLVLNNASDFCLWGSPTKQGTIGDIEARVVSYCTDPKWGGRPIPAGAIHGVQFMRTSAYIQMVGFIDNTALNLLSDDSGGELDPHGADLQGNPLGGVVYSTDPAFSPDGGVTPGQVMNWNFFVGSNTFCFKLCYNNITSPDYCENRYDLIGCEYNMPNALATSTFESCDGDVQTPVGTYTTGGQTITWRMPDPLVGDPPYTPNIPASRDCQTYSSQDLFANLAGASTSASASATGSAGASATAGGSGSASRSASGSGASSTESSAALRAVPILSLSLGSVLILLGGMLVGAVSLF
ncbi:macrophage activating glycoprotein [Roridomyces roridus]|uniref:Macrophage activating glycoprotein n=1 Tax=Roridomyces roridus TaxID=1738132 RepID=A0AAD7BL68_9AGAR|nr:macrophage activating glycoprotein [Roridomyces roridus]